MIKEKISASTDRFATLYGMWARQLQREFADICYQHSLKLIPPVIEIIESVAVFGTWRNMTRTIGISRHLIQDYGWDVVINVFKHEMAHQICHEIFQLGGRPHDQDFLRACDMLGLPKKYCRAGLRADDLSCEFSARNWISDKRGRLIEKIRKLLALSTSANEHEALAALQMAARMMDKHNLEDGDIEEEGNEAVYRILPLAKKRVPPHQRIIASLLSRYFRVTLIHAQLYDAAADQVYKTFELFGRRENVEIAVYCYHFLENRLASLWHTYQKTSIVTVRRSKNSYYLGILHGFNENLEKEQRKKVLSEHEDTVPGEQAVPHPVIQKDKAVEDCIKRRYPRLKKMKKGAPRVSLSVFQQGIAAGRELTLNTALQDRNETHRPKLLA